MPQMMLMSVVLPAPLGPSSAKISPRSISRFTVLSAGGRPGAYVFETSRMLTMGGMGGLRMLSAPEWSP